MPQRNVCKEYVAESYYHIYNRGINKASVFKDDQDFAVFLSLLKRYLGNNVERKLNRTLYVNYHDQLELLAFCLMPNHFHLFVYQETPRAIQYFMKSLGTAYGMYFNKKYKRIGPVFQQRYKAVRIVEDSQLLHITRYIHMNPHSYLDYKWSSLPYYLNTRQTSWVRPSRVTELFMPGDYSKFLAEYQNRRDELAELKFELANA